MLSAMATVRVCETWPEYMQETNIPLTCLEFSRWNSPINTLFSNTVSQCKVLVQLSGEVGYHHHRFYVRACPALSSRSSCSDQSVPECRLWLGESTASPPTLYLCPQYVRFFPFCDDLRKAVSCATLSCPLAIAYRSTSCGVSVLGDDA